MEIVLDKILGLNTLDHYYHFIVLGCGGTGSALVPRFCSLLANTERMHALSLFDADRVEEKNLVRQGFFKSDLNLNKAEVLAAKCSTAFGVDISAYSEYVESEEQLRKICMITPDAVPFIIGCVDTNAVRKMLHNFMVNWDKEIFWLDSGNEEFVGQVVLAHKGPDEDYTDTTFRLPDVTHFFPDMLESEDIFASKVSCAEHAVSHPQAAVTNVTAATILLQFLAAVLDGEVRFHKVTFDAQNASYNTTFNYERFITKYNELPDTLAPETPPVSKHIEPAVISVAEAVTIDPEFILATAAPQHLNPEVTDELMQTIARETGVAQEYVNATLLIQDF